MVAVVSAPMRQWLVRTGSQPTLSGVDARHCTATLAGRSVYDDVNK